MIVFFVGTPGSGKSYEAVKKIIDNLKLGRVVCTNIDGMDQPQAQEYVKNLCGLTDYQFKKQFRFLVIDPKNDIDEVRSFFKTEKVFHPVAAFDPDNDIFEDIVNEVEEPICPPGSLIVIDEAHKFFNARDWQDRNNRELADWASTHRHQGYDLVLITQDIGKVEKQVRSLTEWTYFYRKVNFFGSAVKNKYLCYSYSGDDHTGQPLSKNTRTYQPEIFPCYQSYTTKDAKEVGFMTHSNILKHPVFYSIPVVLAFCLYMFFGKSSFASGDLFGVSKVQHKYDNLQSKGMAQAVKPSQPVHAPISSARPALPHAQPLPVPSAPAVGPAVAFSGVAPAPSPEYSTYKIDGYINDNGKYIISICGHSVRLPSPSVKSWSKVSHTAVALTEVFGEPPQNRPYQAFSAPVPGPSPLLSEAKDKISANDKTAWDTLFPQERPNR